MNRISTPLHAIRRTGLARLGLAAALASGMILGSTALPAAAHAKDAKKGAKEEKEANTKAFAEAYQPLADIVNAADGDYAAAKARIPTVVAVIGNDTDKYAMANLILALGNKTNDVALQSQGVRMILDSGKAAPDQVGQMHYYLARWAYDAKDYAEARTQFQASADAGFTEGEPAALIADTYFGENRNAEGLQYLSNLIENRRAAGQPVPSQWILRGLKVAYDANMTEQANGYAVALVANDPSPANWINALQVVYLANQLDAQGQLDLLRLMRETGALKQRREYVDYIEAADPRRMANEVLTVLEAGKQAGIFTEGDSFYKDMKAQADQRAAADRAEAQALVAEARGDASGTTAQGVADVFLSFGSYQQAAEMYQVALEKGVRDHDMILTRLGIAQTRAGNYSDARAAFEQVAGPRAPIARMWLAHLGAKAAT